MATGESGSVGVAPWARLPRRLAGGRRGGGAGTGCGGLPWARRRCLRPGGRCWCRADPCGLLCLLLTYLSVGYADYVVLEHVLLQPGFRGSLWCPFHAVAFNFIVMMLLACHTRAVFADPGQSHRGGLELPPGTNMATEAEPEAPSLRGCQWSGSASSEVMQRQVCLAVLGLAVGLVLVQPARAVEPLSLAHASTFTGFLSYCLFAHCCHNAGNNGARLRAGMVPLPDTALDFSDLRSSNSAPHKSSQDWTVCNRCETYRPPRAHHCRICHRCVRRMDHHCPWINNCVGELNQKYFIQFLFYTGLASLYAMGLVLTTWLWPTDKSSTGKAEGAEGGVPGNRSQIAHRIILLVESILFGLFVTVIFYDQLVSIITDETPIEQLRNRLLKKAHQEVSHTRKPKIALLREVFGRGFVICWFFPCSCNSSSASRPSYSYLPNYDV